MTPSVVAFLALLAADPVLEAPFKPRTAFRVEVGEPSISDPSASCSCPFASAALSSPDAGVEAFLDLRVCCLFLMPAVKQQFDQCDSGVCKSLNRHTFGGFERRIVGSYVGLSP